MPITIATPRGPVEFVPRDFTKWPRNSPPPAISEPKLRGMTVHWPGAPAAKLYAKADTPAKVFAADEERVGYSIREHNSRPGLTDVGYNYFVGRSGAVFEGRGWTRNGANGALLTSIKPQYPPGETTSNPYWVSVQVIAGTDLPELTDVQWEALKRLYTWIVAKANITNPQVNGHRDVRATACPGDVVHGQLGFVAAAWPVAVTPPTPETPTTPTPEDDDMPAADVYRADDGDRAQFAVSGGIARWITNPDERARLEFIGQIRKGSLIACNRSLFKDFTLVGPLPTYGADYTLPRTVAADFGAVA